MTTWKGAGSCLAETARLVFIALLPIAVIEVLKVIFHHGYLLLSVPRYPFLVAFVIIGIAYAAKLASYYDCLDSPILPPVSDERWNVEVNWWNPLHLLRARTDCFAQFASGVVGRVRFDHLVPWVGPKRTRVVARLFVDGRKVATTIHERPRAQAQQQTLFREKLQRLRRRWGLQEDLPSARPSPWSRLDRATITGAANFLQIELAEEVGASDLMAFLVALAVEALPVAETGAGAGGYRSAPREGSTEAEIAAAEEAWCSFPDPPRPRA